MFLYAQITISTENSAKATYSTRRYVKISYKRHKHIIAGCLQKSDNKPIITITTKALSRN